MIDPAERAWIQTATGGKFHILDPRPDEVNITDIAHSLSQQCRYTGHTRVFMSVAEHCVHASALVPEEDALWALLHDASEAYISDISRPAKHYTKIGVSYLPIEAAIMAAICVRFGLPVQEPESVRAADNAMLYAEKEELLPPMVWDTKWSVTEAAAKVRLRCWSPYAAEVAFLRRFTEITGIEAKPLERRKPRRAEVLRPSGANQTSLAPGLATHCFGYPLRSRSFPVPASGPDKP